MLRLEAPARCDSAEISGEFLGAIRRLLGDNHVTFGAAASVGAAATYALDSEPLAIMRPGNVTEVSAIVRIARDHGVRLLPVSSGLNWGYGSKAPPGRAAVLQLDRLNRILDFDDELGWVRVQCGVTQAQLRAFLRERGDRWWMDATGAATGASVVANSLERGFGHTPLSDHFGNCCDFEVVLPDGSLARTGFGSIPGAHAAPVYRYGLGPVVDGLFSQSTHGIVTAMTLWLMRRPEDTLIFSVAAKEPAQIGPIAAALAQARLEGSLHQPIHLANQHKVLSSVAPLPWSELPEGRALEGEPLARLRRRYNVAAWQGLSAVYGTRAQTRAQFARVRRLLADTGAAVQTVTPAKVALGRRLAPLIERVAGVDLRPALNIFEHAAGLLRGEPSDAFLSSVYWRKRTGVPAGPLDPNRDRVGLRWIAPVAPATAEHVAALVSLSERVILEHGLEPLLTLNLIGPRAVALVTGLTWDRDVPDEDARAHACHDALVAATTQAGYWPYRRSTGLQLSATPDSAGLLARLHVTDNPLVGRVAD